VEAVCDQAAERAHNAASNLGAHAFTSWERLLQEPLDMVVVNLPHHLHAEVAIAALRAGRHVLVEKPLANSVAEARQMLRAAREAGRHLLVAETAAFDSGALETGRRFERGDLGRFLTGSHANQRRYFHDNRPEWFLDPEKSGGGMFSNVGYHRLAQVGSALPGLKPMSVVASIGHLPDHEVEACTSALLSYENGGAMHFEEVGYYPSAEWLKTGLHFYFERGAVAWTKEMWRCASPSGEVIEEPLTRDKLVYGPVYADLLSALEGGRCSIMAQRFAQDVAVVRAAYASAREGVMIDLAAERWSVEEDAVAGARKPGA
jgi:predicted dehydrogenase